MLRGSPRASPNPSHRPFDLRFQSRLSSSTSINLRPSSPYLPRHRSRQSSLASQAFSYATESDGDALQPPWDVVRWNRLKKISGQVFSEVGRRNFGRPTCTAISTVIVIGTSKGIILVFDYHQNLNAIIGPGTKGMLKMIYIRLGIN
jgi:vacuolar protein sorting-associated protein 8